MPTPPPDLLDLKMMPAWVNEPARKSDYADFEGEEEGRSSAKGAARGATGKNEVAARNRASVGTSASDQNNGEDQTGGERNQPPRAAPAPLPQVTVRFLPHPRAFESVIAQIKSGAVTYSVFALGASFSRQTRALRCAADSG